MIKLIAQPPLSLVTGSIITDRTSKCKKKSPLLRGSNRKGYSRRVLVEICANPVLEICFDLLEMFCRKGGDRFGFIADVII